MLILTDLDDTLFQTKPKCPAHDTHLLPMSYLRDGSESGYATRRQQSLIAWLSQGDIVPVTARDRETLSRVNISQKPAICANGGCIITPSGEIDAEWHDMLTQQSKADRLVTEVHHSLTGHLDERFRHWILKEGELDLYIVIKSNIDDGESLNLLLAEIHRRKPAGWRIHRNGNNLAILPSWLNKRNAAQYFINKVRDETPHQLIIGMGDSHSDVGFMDLCDMAMTPTSSQIWKAFTASSAWCV